MKICLVGNPNCGKTTVFNRLTGARQKVGNWAGVTVEKKVGQLLVNGKYVEIIDLPGIYSLDQIDPGQDEAIASAFLLSKDYDLIINVLDTANLARNLVLTTQLIELNCPMLIAANMVDVARQKGVEIDFQALAQRLNTTVIPVIGSTGEGFPQLVSHIQARYHHQQDKSVNLQQADSNPEFATQEEHLTERMQQRYERVKQLTAGLIQHQNLKHNWTEHIDNLVLSRALGIPVFLLMMYLMFSVAINLGAVFIDFFDILFGAFLVDGLSLVLESISSPDWLITLLASGIGSGIQLVATFVPVIGILYLCLAFLEDSGYLSRAAFVVDRLMLRIGLPGNAFVPLIVGFGCNVPAVMAARTMNRETDRLLTISMAPFMSCGARLTVYALFAAAFFPDNGEKVVFGLYLLGILVAVATGWLFRKYIFSSNAAPAYIEMPAYHLPIWRNIFLTTWHRLKGFLLRAGKTIVMVVTLLSFINSIGTDGSFGNENSDKSLLSVASKQLTPIFAPLGIEQDNWPATVGIFTGMFAKEAIVGTLDALYVQKQEVQAAFNLTRSIQEALLTIPANFSDMLGAWSDPLGLRSATDSADAQGVQNTTLTYMASLFHDQWGAFCYLVLILLYTPCVAVMGAVSREAGSQWMWVVIGWTSLLSYGIATSLYQLGHITRNPLFSVSWITAVVIFISLFIRFLKHTTQYRDANRIQAINIE